MARAKQLWPKQPAPPGRMIQVGSLSLHVQEWGPAEATSSLLLVHGYLAASHVWGAVAQRLASDAGWRVVAVDLPGCGYSDRPADRSYAVEWLATVCHEAALALQLKRPLLGGHSLGGAVALHAAARSFASWSGLVLVSPLSFPTPLPRLLRPASKRPGLFQLFFRSPLGRSMVRPALRRNYAGVPDAEAAPMLDLVIAHLDAPGGWRAATRMGLQAAHRRPIEPLLARVRAPALLLWGSDDGVHPPALGERLQQSLAGAELARFEGCGHNPHLEQAEPVATAIRDWHSKLPKPEQRRPGRAQPKEGDGGRSSS